MPSNNTIVEDVVNEEVINNKSEVNELILSDSKYKAIDRKQRATKLEKQAMQYEFIKQCIFPCVSYEDQVKFWMDKGYTSYPSIGYMIKEAYKEYQAIVLKDQGEWRSKLISYYDQFVTKLIKDGNDKILANVLSNYSKLVGADMPSQNQSISKSDITINIKNI